MANDPNLDLRCINTIRFLSVDAVEKAKSGHPGLPLGAAPMGYVLWDRFLRHNPANPHWPNRDRFVLSAGHGSMLLYSLLHLTGYDLTLEDIQAFRQLGSRTPGHPELGHTPGVEATTGPLGQGFAMGVGMALMEHHLAAKFNREGFPVVDHFTYAIVSDGDLMEGIASEAASFAGAMHLGKLVYLYDDNHVSLEGGTELTFTEDVLGRFQAYGWHTSRVADGNDPDAITQAIEAARKVKDKPSLIAIRTHIGYGSPRQDTHNAHGEPLGPEGAKATKQKLGWPEEPPFLIPDEAREHLRMSLARGAAAESEWKFVMEGYRARYPGEAALLERMLRGELPAGWGQSLPTFQPTDPAAATRETSEKVLNVLAGALPELVGGSADLSPSTKTLMKGVGSFSGSDRSGRNFHFGVRENAMAAMLNGMALHGGAIPYGATFLVFSDYARPSLRLAALMQTHTVFVLTHDSIFVGEDGPTHQPIEHLTSLRAMPGMTVIRPADANETVAAWKVAIEHRGPVSLVLSRQKVPVLEPTAALAPTGVPRGAYVLSEAKGGSPRAILIATGTEVELALQAQRKLSEEGVAARVVSMPCWELFEHQTEEYRSLVLLRDIPRVSVEAGATLAWSRYVGSTGIALGIDRFGASAPGPHVARALGLSVEAVVVAVRQVTELGRK